MLQRADTPGHPRGHARTMCARTSAREDNIPEGRKPKKPDMFLFSLPQDSRRKQNLSISPSMCTFIHTHARACAYLCLRRTMDEGSSERDRGKVPCTVHPYMFLHALHTTHYTPHTTHHTPHNKTRYTLHATRYTLHATRYTLHATRYTLHATRYTLHATRYTLQVTHDT